MAFYAKCLIALAVLAMLAALKAGYDGHVTKPYRDEIAQLKGDKLERDVALAKQKRDAAADLEALRQQHAAQLQVYVTNARKSDEDHEKRIAAVRAAVNAANGVRLYDPWRRGDGSSWATTAAKGDPSSPESAAAQPSELSPGLVEFLKRQAGLADEVAEYAATCYAFVSSP